MNKYIADNVSGVVARIHAAEERSGREPGSVRLLAATKNRTGEEIREAIEAGITLAGENRVQELIAKAPDLPDVELHFIGHLQRNKARAVVELVELIHSVDSERLVLEIDRKALAAGKRQRVLLQVNVGGEESKSGVSPDELEELLRAALALENVEVMGLSTIAPLTDDPEAARRAFARLRELGGEMESRVPGFTSRELSMGMTGDFETAIEEGSTIVRVGTAIFGPRPMR